MVIQMLGLAWQRLISRLTPQEEAVNTAQDQELLNRINLGQFRPVPVSSTQGLGEPAPPGESAAGSAGNLGSTESMDLAGADRNSAPSSEMPPSVPSPEELRAQRLAHFEQPEQQ
eukprot:s1456_g10.t1